MLCWVGPVRSNSLSHHHRGDGVKEQLVKGETRMWTHHALADKELAGDAANLGSIVEAVTDMVQNGRKIGLVNVTGDPAGSVLHGTHGAKIVFGVNNLGAVSKATLTMPAPSDTELRQEAVILITNPIGNPVWAALAARH